MTDVKTRLRAVIETRGENAAVCADALKRINDLELAIRELLLGVTRAVGVVGEELSAPLEPQPMPRLSGYSRLQLPPEEEPPDA
jgi:hypothetical protein